MSEKIKPGDLISPRSQHHCTLSPRPEGLAAAYHKQQRGQIVHDLYRPIKLDDVMLYLGNLTGFRSVYHSVILDGERVYVEFNQKRFKKIGG